MALEVLSLARMTEKQAEPRPDSESAKPAHRTDRADGSSLISILGAAAFVSALAFSDQLAPYADLPKRSALQAGTLLALLVWLLNGPKPIALPPETRLVAAGWLLMVFGWWRASDSFSAAETGVHWSGCLVAGFLALQGVGHAKQARALMGWLALAGTAVALIGLLQFYGLVSIAQESAPPASTFGNRNWAGQIMVPTLPLLGYFWVRTNSVPSRWMLALAMVVSSVYVLKVASTAAILSIGAEAGVAAGLVLRSRARRSDFFARVRPGWTAVVAALALLTVLALVTPRGFGVDPSLRREMADLAATVEPVVEDESGMPVPASGRTIRIRLASLQVTGRLISEAPWFGHGLRDFAIRFPAANAELGDPLVMSRHMKLLYTHHDGLQLAAELGLPALLLIGFVAVRWVGRALVGGASHPSNSRSQIAGIALVGIGVNTFFSHPMYNAVPPYWLALLAAIAIAPGRRSIATGKPNVGLRVVGFAVVLSMLGWVGWQHRLWSSELGMGRLHAAVVARDWSDVRKRGLEVSASWPARFDHLAHLAKAQLVLGDAAAALETLDALQAVYPDHPPGLALEVRALEALGEEASAQAVRARLRFLVPRDPPV